MTWMLYMLLNPRSALQGWNLYLNYIVLVVHPETTNIIIFIIKNYNLFDLGKINFRGMMERKY